jgi:hypothetical protein
MVEQAQKIFNLNGAVAVAAAQVELVALVLVSQVVPAAQEQHHHIQVHQY